MNLNELINNQISMDRSHGFLVDFEKDSEKYLQLTKDLVGLFGEIGEFSNLVKKINIHLERPTEYSISIPETEELLKEELADCLIYLLRISAILGVNLEDEILKKMNINQVRYENLHPK